MKHTAILALVLLGAHVDADTVIGKGSTGWSYLLISDGTDPALADADFNSTWFNPTTGGYTGGAYDGPAFTAGAPAPIHYGGVDGLSGGTTLTPPVPGMRYTMYAYKVFDGGSGFDNLNLNLLADDGAFVYLNGVLIARDGVTDPDTFTKMSSLGNEVTYDSIPLIGTPVVNAGPNLLALSIHQQATDSSDLGFDLELLSLIPGVPQIVRGPYLQSGGPDRMTVRWRTDLTGNTVVRYGDAPGNLTETATISESVTEHVAPLTSLAPDTTYYYKVETTNGVGTVSAGADADHHFKTHPVVGTRKPTRIWVIGDSGTTTAAKHNVYTAYRTRTAGAPTDAWLMLGDNAYNSGTDAEFQAAVFDSYPELLREAVLWSCIGNHEAATSNGQPYLDLHTFPTGGECGGVASGTERYYSFDYGNIHFISIDSQTSGNYNDTPGGGGMVDWLELDLKATAQDWIIALMHHGPYTKGSHDSDTESHHIAIRQYVIPLLERYGADLVLSGHSHCYERSMLINGHHSNMSTADSTSGTFSPANIVDGGNGSTVGSVDGSGTFLADGGDGAYEKPLASGETGTIYSTCGASGKVSSWVGGSTATVNPNPHPVFLVNLRVMGSLILEVDDNTLHAQYIDGSNTVRDDFTLLKGSLVQINAIDPDFAEYGPDDTATIRVTRAGATSLAENITYQVSGSATNGTDFAPSLTGTASFTTGATTADLILTRTPDSLAEGPESLSLDLVPATTTVSSGTGERARYFVGAADHAEATLADAPSQQWWFQHFGPGLPGPSEWALDGDDDGLSRLEELAYGGSEGANDRSLLPQETLSPTALELHYRRDTSISDLQFEMRHSDTLSVWDDTDIVHVREGPANPGGIELWKGSTDIDRPSEYLRLRLSLP